MMIRTPLTIPFQYPKLFISRGVASRRTSVGRGKIYSSVLETICDTPIIRVNNVAPKGVNMYVKAEYFNPAHSVKVRTIS